MRLVLATVVLFTAAAPRAQVVPPAAAPPDSAAHADSSPGSLDARLTRAIYGIDQPVFAGVMRGANRSAYPVFIAASPVTAGVALVRGDSFRPAARVFASEALTSGAVLGLKRVLRRPRPYRGMAGLVARDRQYSVAAPLDPFSFPSGHAALAFSIATSVTLSDHRLAAPAYVWATAVGVARVWHGVHYPSDVLAGALVGTGAAVLVHAVVPSGNGDEAEAPAVPFHLVVTF